MPDITMANALVKARQIAPPRVVEDSPNYVRGVADMLASLYLPSVPFNVGRSMIMTAITADVWT